MSKLIKGWNYEPPPTLLDAATRKRLHAVGYTEVHHTSLSYWRECHATLGFEIGKAERIKDVRLLLGGVLHKAFERGEDCRTHGRDHMWWQQLFYICRDEQVARDGEKSSYFFNGSTVKGNQITQWSLDFCNPNILGGVTMQGLVVGTLDRLKTYGYEIAGSELHLSYKDGVVDPIRFDGTVDLKLVNRRSGMLGLVDVKSYGIWQAYLDNKAAKAERIAAEDVTYLPQNRHYHWLHNRKYPTEEVTFYGLIFPTNLVPYQKSGSGYKAVDIKDVPLFMGPALPLSYVRDYEYQMVSWLKLIADRHFEKLMPMKYGKVGCPDCPWFKACMKDSTASRTADLFYTNEYNYVRD